MDTPRIEIEEIAEAMRRGDRVTFVDTRSSKSWAAASEQIPGSARATADQIDTIADELAEEGITVAYCDSPGEASSARAAHALRELGHTHAYALRGGFDAWKRAGLPVEPRQHESTVGPLESPP